MGNIRTDITERTGLPEDEARARLVKLIPSEKYEEINTKMASYRLGDTYPPTSWPFIIECLVSPSEMYRCADKLAELLKKRSK